MPLNEATPCAWRHLDWKAASWPASGTALCTLLAVVCLGGKARAQNRASLPGASAVSSERGLPLNRTSQQYFVAKGDLLDVEVVGVTELSREYRVDSEGLITMPMLSGPVAATGLTLGQLSQVIRKELIAAGMLTDPQVTVTVKSSAWNSVVLSGAAKKPGVYPVYGHTTLLDLLTAAEGLSDEAGSTAVVTRAANPAPGGTANPAIPNTANCPVHTLDVDMWRLWRNGDTSLNVDLYAGDRVTIQKVGLVYVLGGVNRAGGFPVADRDEQMTILKSIALAGNFTREARPAKAVIIRKVANAPGGRQALRVDLRKILSNRAPDQPLAASDILYVPESGVKRTLDTVINTAVYTTIWHAPL